MAKKSVPLDLADAVELGTGPKPKPEGTYPAMVGSATLEVSKAGNDMLVLVFTITEGEFAGVQLKDYNVLTGKGASFTRQNLLAFHDEDELTQGFVVDPRNYFGKPVIIAVEKELFKHSDPDKVNKYRDDGLYEKSVITAVLRADDEVATTAVQATLNAEEGSDAETPF